MAFVYNSLVALNLTSLLLCIIFCYIAVQQSSQAEANQGLTVVPSEEDDNDDGIVSVEDSDDSELDVFVPTKEWQEIQPGQAIPKGLHVRLNLQTGLKEAKLMDGKGNEGDNLDAIKYWSEGEGTDRIAVKHREFTVNELKKALKDFKATSDDVQDQKIKDDALKKKFRSYNDLKEDFKKMNMNVKTEQEIISDLVETLKAKTVLPEQKLRIMQDLEYYVHQVDNAQDFATMGGLGLMLNALNSTDSDMRIASAHVLGSAMAGNPKVQVTSLESGVLQALLRTISQPDMSLTEHSRLLFAISSMVRHFPVAQKKLIELGGLSALGQLFKNSDLHSLQVKAVTLVSDLVTEKHILKKNSKSLIDAKTQVEQQEAKQEQEKLRQYDELQLEDALVEQGWCENIRGLLSSAEHDTREKVLHAMLALGKRCHNKFEPVTNRIVELWQEYQPLAYKTEDEYYIQMLQLVGHVLESLQTGGRGHDEL